MREQRGEGLLVALRAPRAARGRQPATGRTAADVAQVHVTDALNGPLAPADRDGPVRKLVLARLEHYCTVPVLAILVVVL